MFARVRFDPKASKARALSSRSASRSGRRSESCGATAASTRRQLARQPARERSVDLGRLLLRHPMARSHRGFGEVRAVAPHRLGQARGDRLAGEVELGVQKQHRQVQAAAIARLQRVGLIARMVHVPAVGPEEAVAPQPARVVLEVLLGDHVEVDRHVGRAAEAAEPAAVAPRGRKPRRLAAHRRVALAEQRAHGGAHVGLHRACGGVEALFVVELVVPLPHRVLGLGVHAAVDVGHEFLRAETLGEVRHAQIRHRHAGLRVVARQAPHHRAAPVVADPHGLVAAQALQQLEHVGHRMLERIVLMPRVDARPAVATHVGRDGAKAQRTEARQLMAPAQRQLGPAVHEDDRRSVRGAAGQVEGAVACRRHQVLGHRKRHRVTPRLAAQYR